jgi:anti-sigma factor RsiW
MYNNWGGATTLTRGCEDEKVQLALSSYLDGEANAYERTLAEIHLANCPSCRNLMANWSQDAGRFRHNTHDRQMEWISRAIADQTRAFLARELTVGLGQSQTQCPQPVRRRQPGFGVFGALASMGTLVVALLGIFALLLTGTPGNVPLSPARPSTMEAVTPGLTNFQMVNSSSRVATPPVGFTYGLQGVTVTPRFMPPAPFPATPSISQSSPDRQQNRE